MSTTSELATFAAGCFWGVESVFMDTNGVLSTEVGYTGGQAENVTYKEVCSGETGHAEAVKIIFDPSVVSYSQLLEVFFNNHDATQLNRQGPDVGTQYRSAIFVHNEAQRQQAQSFITTLDNSKKLPRAVTTVVADAVEFFRAEEYHQQYNLKNGKSCSIQ
ncbi:MAG: peptide-methionine (S)-S-oxide reductase MsrA [Planctomycetes bacterium]|nr:peptide-methionine (S)-S-oxide reductase MsrA [Planctomycetota bacterium]